MKVDNYILSGEIHEISAIFVKKRKKNSHAGTPPSFNVIMLGFSHLSYATFFASIFDLIFSFLIPLNYPFAAMASSSTPAVTKRHTIALVGFGNLAKFICEEISADDRFALVVISRQVCSFTQDFFPSFHH